MSEKEHIPLALHLDHGTDMAVVKAAISSGYYTSVMYDGSALSYADNLANTKKVVALAHAKKISVEAELGAIGGKEDHIDIKADQARLTDPVLAKDFVKRTRCDSLGVAIGTAHGAFKFLAKPKLDLRRLELIRQNISNNSRSRSRHPPPLLHQRSIPCAAHPAALSADEAPRAPRASTGPLRSSPLPAKTLSRAAGTALACAHVARARRRRARRAPA